MASDENTFRSVRVFNRRKTESGGFTLHIPHPGDWSMINNCRNNRLQQIVLINTTRVWILKNPDPFISRGL